MEITAKVLARLEKRTGTSTIQKPWVSQDFVVEYNYDTQYPKKAVINFFGEERVREAQELLHKDTIATFRFDISAREITTQAGKKMWVQSLDCYNITIPNAGTNQTTSAPTQTYSAPLQQPAPMTTEVPGLESNDELPF